MMRGGRRGTEAEMALQRIQLKINGKPVEREAETRKNLADFLRHDLSLTGTHVGCEHGVCGSCTILCNGEPIRSCLLLAVQADQAEITTVEGLAENGALNSLQQGFKRHHALQCIVDAIVEASGGEPQKKSLHEQSHAPSSGFIGAPVERAEDNELLTGKGVFVDDIDFSGMLHAYVVRSAHAHANILCIDTHAAKRSPGVVDVVTFSDLGSVRKFPLTIPHPNLKPLTEFPLAKDEARYVGEPIRSCLLLAVQADQAEITTVEGLAENGALNSLQQGFKRHHALQCGSRD